MTLIEPTDTSAHRSHTPRGIALAAAASMVAAISLVAMPLSAHAATAVMSRPSVAIPAVAAGKLAPSCTAIGTTRTCDLYAMEGTTSMLGGAPINIWGFSSTGVAGSATAPGPLLVVNQGDTVSLTLHNQIAGQNVSLAFPGQPTSNFAPGSLSAVAEETGISSTDPAKTYTFTASRAGTFIYEAGHTANGTRQVAMGLAGALVVRPADGTAYGVVTGFPSTAYNDDAVVVLSEIDPALNAAPATFDMRSFAPKYRLINGKPFPSTDPISTDQGNTVLLRYANVGSQAHTMGLLGNDQTQVAQDGHAAKYAETEVVAELPPGATADTLVTMPTGPESKIALYEAAGRLDNNGQTAADPQSLAFGGMLTFLDTAAPLPSTDGVGPVSSNVTASPNPSSGLADVTVKADLSDATTGGSAVTGAELVIDDAVTTGVGFGTAMSGAFGTVDVANATGTITTAVMAGLDAGKHHVLVRALDSAGNWGVVGGVIFNLPKTGPQTTNGSATPSPANGTDVDISATGDDRIAGGTITDAEYFVDTAPALGSGGTGTAMARNRTAAVVSEDATIPAAAVLALGEGIHHVYVHSKDSLGLWGPPLDIALPVDLTGPGVEAASVGPNPTNGVLTDKAHPGYLLVSARITDRDSGGGLQNAVTDAEGFLDPTVAVPTGGTGFQLVALDGAMDAQTENVYGLIPISQVKAMTGTHHVFVRGQDAAGNWGTMFGIDLVIDKTAPVLGTVVGTPNPTNGAAALALTAPVSETGIAVAEFWLGTTDPGVGKATSVTFSMSGGSNVMATVPLAGILQGSQRFNLRVRDLAGNWSNAVNTTVTVSRPNAIFSNGFTSTSSPFGWSSSTGGTTVTTNAGIPAGGGNLGLQVTLPGGTANRLTSVTDNSPSVETGYHASFIFDANTLTSGTGANTALTVFEARTGNPGAQVFAVQFHRTTQTGTYQLRTVMSRSGATALTSSWVNVTAGVHTIRVDWTSGPGTGASAGSLKLLRDGTQIVSQTGNTSTLRVETATLGVFTGVTSNGASSMKGTAYFDSFVSTRNTLP